VRYTLLPAQYDLWLTSRDESVNSQVDAVGQIGGGPVVGAIGNRSIRAALVVSALILSPVLPLYATAIRQRGHGCAQRWEEAGSP
jgi:hypothetical protein